LSSEQSADVAKLRRVVNHLVFQVPFDPRVIGTDASNMADFTSAGDSELDRWNAAMDKMLPPSKKSDTKLPEDPSLTSCVTPLINLENLP
jgi:hypothetical protein